MICDGIMVQKWTVYSNFYQRKTPRIKGEPKNIDYMYQALQMFQFKLSETIFEIV